MATRLFFDYNVAASSFPTRAALWEAEAGTPLRRRLDRARYGSTGALTTTYSDTTATNPWDVMMVVGVSKPLQGDQTITGTWKSLVSVAESSATADFISQGVIRVFSGDMTTERGVIYAGNGLTTVTGNGEFGTSQQTRAIVPQASGTPSDIAVSSVAALSGDVIVVEYGFRALNTVTTSFTGTFHVLNSQNVTATPTPETIATSSSVSWIEFSQDLVFQGDYAFGDADDIDVPIDLTATMSTPVGLSLSGSVDIDVDPVLTTNFVNRRIGSAEFKAAVVASAPYLYWPMDEGSGATILDASGNGRDGTITGGAWSTALTGSPYGDTGYNFAAAATGNITWSGTIPAASTADGFTIMMVYAKTADNLLLNSTAANGDPWYYLEGATPYFYVSGTTTGDRLAYSKQPVTIYRCVILRVTKTNGNTALTSEQLVFGQQVAAAGVGGLANNGTRFQIGKGSTTGSATLQHVAYWDRPLTTNEIDLFSNSFLVESTPSAIDGDLDVNVDLTGTLSTAHPLIGDLDVDVDLTGTATVSVALAGEIAEDIDLTGTGTFTVPMAGEADVDVSLDGFLTTGSAPLLIAGEADVDVSLDGTLTTIYILNIAADLDAEVGLDAHLTVPPRVWVAGDIDIPVDLVGDSFEESFKAGTLDVPFGLDATLTLSIAVEPSTSTIELDELTGTVNAQTVLSMNTQVLTTDVMLAAKVRSPLVIPPAPEPAAPGEIPVASGVLLRALHGVVVTMATPTIEDGQPQ